MPKPINIIGLVCGKLTVIEITNLKIKGSYKWKCKCDCGKFTIVNGNNLRKKRTLSCGCLKHEINSTRNGLSLSTEYVTWKAMKFRCYNKNCKEFKYYGGRGIIVCDEWMSSFDRFLSDMGNRPSNKHSLDRIDNNGNYCKENCRWATRLVQNYNTRKRLGLTSKYKGVCFCKAKNKWVSQITYNKKNICLGYYDLESDAYTAYKNKLFDLTGLIL